MNETGNRTLAERIAIVTGASRGLGKAIALALAKEGAKVALVSRNRVSLDQVAGQIRQSGGTASVHVADVSSESDVQACEREIVQNFGRADILINNAGIIIRKPITSITLDEWNMVMTTNVTSAFLMCRAFIAHMTAAHYGRIINVASTMASVSLPGRTAYSASKTALLGITRALALELANDGITVNTISPGPFTTELTEPLLRNPQVHQEITSRIPLGRWGRPEELGELAVYLCSEHASFITGTDIKIDGGWCAQ